MKRLAVFISGQGSNLAALIERLHVTRKAEIVVVISDQADAYGLQRARDANINTEIISHSDREQFQQQLLTAVQAYDVDYILLAGFMRILDKKFVATFPRRILNIHPSLLPKYPGLHTHAKALAAGDKEHGATVHLVNNVLDGGPILAQARLAIAKSETRSTLKNRVQIIEHILYPTVVEWLISNRLNIHQDMITFDEDVIAEHGIQLNVELETNNDLN